LRLAASVAISLSLFLATMLIPVGFTRLVWLLPGKAVAPVVATVLPQAWVTGDLTSDSHWHVVSGGGFAVLCGVLFWALVIFGAWQWSIAKRVAEASRHA